MVTLNTQQKEAKDKIVAWFNKRPSGDNLIFTLAGFAGTGKTFLIDYVINDVLHLNKNEVAFVAPTGKAASLLVQKGNKATTIHRLVYRCVDSDKKDKNGKPIPMFVKRKEIPNYKLIVVDEISMVNAEILKDIISFDIPILAVGDPGQLPPIMAKSHTLLEHPDYTLTDIVRQAEGNSIIELSFLARTGQPIPNGRYGNSVIVIDRKKIPQDELDKILLNADQVLCGRNETRKSLNAYIRGLKGYDQFTPMPGDKLICCQNNYNIFLDEEKEYPLVNGNIGYVESYETVNEQEHVGKLRFKVDFLDKPTDEDIICDQTIFDFMEHSFLYDRHQRVGTLKDGSYRVIPHVKYEPPMTREEYKARIAEVVKIRMDLVDETQISDFDYGYVISVHKSQGSQFGKVVLFDESGAFPASRDKWLYTAITRAVDKLIIIK